MVLLLFGKAKGTGLHLSLGFFGWVVSSLPELDAPAAAMVWRTAEALSEPPPS